MTNPQVLDVCCGSRMFYFDKHDTRVLFCDKRAERHILCDGRVLEINPDIQLDFKNLPFDDETFHHVCFDPPHLINVGQNSWLAKKYGQLNKLTWQEDLDDFIKGNWLSGEDECNLREELQSILRAEDEYEIVEAIRNFDCNVFDVADFWEVDYRKYRYGYIWLCYAIVWGIKKFDEVSI